MLRKMRSLLTGEGTTGAGGGASAGAGTGQGTAGAAGAGAAGAAAGGAGAAAAAGAGASGAAGGGQAAGAQGAAGGFASAAATGTDGQGQGQGAGTAGAGQAGAAQPYELTLPEGVREADKAILTPFLKTGDHRLTKESAEVVVKTVAKALEDRNKADLTAYEQKLADQRKALETHPKIGGANQAKALETARRAVLTLDKLDPGLGTEFAKELAAAGLDNSVVAARLLVLLGEQLAEDSVGTTGGGQGGSTGAQQPLTKEQKLARDFPSLAQELLNPAGVSR
jgi:hypothetical protein